MRKHDEERKASEAAKVARTERRTAAKAASAPDTEGFSTVVAGGGSKPARTTERPKSAKLLPPSAFAALAESESESESEPEPEPERDAAQAEPEDEPVKLTKAQRQAKNRAKRGKRLDVGL